MDIIDFTLKNYKLYSPSTGELIYNARENNVNEDERSFVACWHFDSDNYADYYRESLVEGDLQFFLPGITTKNDDLFRFWEDYLINFSHLVMDPNLEISFDLEDFILSYESKESNLICFRISKPENPLDRKYFVIDMYGKVECHE